MYIISKFKDYYDHQVAIYGRDEKLIFERTDRTDVCKGTLLTTHDPTAFKNSDEAWHSVLYVGDMLVHLFGTDSHVYTHFDLIDDSELDKPQEIWGVYELGFKHGKRIKVRSYFARHVHLSLRAQVQASRAHNIYRIDDERWQKCTQKPLLLLTQRRLDVCPQPTYNPSLSKLGVYLPPDFVWQNLVAYLSKLKSAREITPDVPDAQKIINKGFDVKTSFRPKMKV